MADGIVKLALLWPRDVPKWHAAAPREHRLNRVFEALAALGIEPEPALYADDVADQVRAQLCACDGVLSGSTHFLPGETEQCLMLCCVTSPLTAFGSVRIPM
jgi:hypothetical protein